MAATPPASRASRKTTGSRGLAARAALGGIVRFLTSMRVALMLLFVLALMTLVGTLFAQVPADVRGDPQTYATWLDSVRPKYGGWTGVLETLGFFSVFSTIWFKAALGLLSASLVTCSVRRGPRLWKTAARPRMVMTEAFFDRAPLRAKLPSEADPQATLAAVRAGFRSHQFHTAIERSGEDIHVCADRFRWAPFGRIVSHMSLVLILIGATLTATGGFRNDSFAVPVGEREEVGNGTGLAVEAKSFSDSYYVSGEPRDYSSELVLYENGAPVRTETIRVNHPMRHQGITFYQSFFGAAVVIEVRKPDGGVLFDQGVPLLYESKDGNTRIGRFSLPQKGLTIFVVGPASGKVDARIAAGQTQFEVYRTGSEKPVGMQLASEGEQTRIAGLDFRFVRERQFTGLIIARERGWTLVWIGSTLLVLGISTVFFFPHRRVRAVVRRRAGGSEVGVAAIRRRDPVFESQFQDLVDDIQRAVARAGAR